ncbi:MAG: MBL fold metallo-hydrolase [Acidobacteria bacterium]|nr:MAG: MBL fold metallo-hydrolase [Acidobacteriota bacterium]
MPHVAEIAPDIYRICVFYPELNLQFNHFLVKDEEPLLFHTGLRRMFPEVREGVAKVLDPAHLRWISWSHFESDECGSLNEWLTIAPHAQPACGMVGALVNVNDFSSREARILAPQDVLTTGKYRFRYYNTPQLPHGWDAGVMFEEIERVRKSLTTIQASPLANYVPYTHNTGRILEGLASLKPKTLATMHGSSFCGDCREALLDLATVMKEVLDKPSYNFAEVQQAVGP